MAKGLAFEPPLKPMLAKAMDDVPSQPGWRYEPKWDGFRALVFYDGDEVYLQSRDGKPFNRYFPELEKQLAEAIPSPSVLDGEIVVIGPGGLDFDALQMRIHPAASRVSMLANEYPASFVAFDLLAQGTTDLRKWPFAERRDALENATGDAQPPLYVSPSTAEEPVARDWFHRFEGAGFDGVIARPDNSVYEPGKRALAKIKHHRTADCVVGGFRWLKDHAGSEVGSLLLGLYDRHGVLHHVGHTSSFKAKERRELAELLAPYVTEDESTGFGEGRTPGALNRWNQSRDMSWVRLRPELVCEVHFDQLQGDRFRHAATFLRWRFDRSPEDCRYAQLAATAPAELMQIFRPAH
ncbi:MAG: ATP-dependent DNA ligase [Dehalococcoidia bacterium]|nr:ATP-dependent DNA ligase [Dehalococcoidia bacterium]